MNEFIVIIILVVSALQIALFIKIWQMTNDTAVIRKTLSIILYRSLPVEKRKEELVNRCHKIIKDYSMLVGGESKEKIEAAVSETLNKFDKSIKDVMGKYDLIDVYSIEELKNDMIKRYIKPK